MEPSKRTVQKCDSLCEPEKEYIQQRKKKILESLKRNGIDCELEDVPHIALLGSGGGQRAAVALLGSLYQLEQDDLLDTLLYILGLSGSTWAMASLYREPAMDVSRVIATHKGDSVSMGEAVAWMKGRVTSEDFSLTHIWGALTSARVMKEMDKRRLSDEAKREASNPYPIYSAIEKHCFLNGPVEGAWFEMSPHQCGFSDLGLFVETSCLGSRFRSGELVEEREEMDMVELQGILGCALADEQTIKDMMPEWMKEAEALHPFLQAYQALRTMVELSDVGMATSSIIAGLEKVLQDRLKNQPLDSDSLSRMTAEEKQGVYERWGEEFLAGLALWCGDLEDGPFKLHLCWIITHVLPLVVKWEWGTVNNFLYKYEDSTVPPSLQTRERMNLIDAGLMINAPYPPVLGPRRGVDLIIAPDFGAGEIFEVILEHTRDYSRKLNRPFPALDPGVLAERDQPRDFYVFQGSGREEPTVLYMPLFNLHNCQDKEEIAKQREEFKTFQMPYSAEKIDRLLEKAKVNLRSNKQKILEQIKMAVQRRQSQRS